MSGNNYPLVSIFIISYNGKEFLREAIESFASQTYSNIEICISDDASTDGTYELLLEYKSKLGSKLKYNINDKTLGITKNSNKCLELCSGEYIAYCGGDDLFLPTKIEEQLKAMHNSSDVIATFTDAEIFDNESNEIIHLFSTVNKPIPVGNVKDVLKHGCYFAACTVMIKRSVALKFDEQLPVASDFFQMVQMLATNINNKIVYIDKVLSRYRRHKRNVTNVLTKDKLLQNQIDFLNAYNKSRYMYPEYGYDISLGISSVYRSYGKYVNKKYYISAFFECPFYWKNIIKYLYLKIFG